MINWLKSKFVADSVADELQKEREAIDLAAQKDIAAAKDEAAAYEGHRDHTQELVKMAENALTLVSK